MMCQPEGSNFLFSFSAFPSNWQVGKILPLLGMSMCQSLVIFLRNKIKIADDSSPLDDN